jgi:YrbI family 3-deoxy-D-manno-octulosonate 8-phosphate phosphatase
MDVLAVIPARGGSKGVPRKNVLPLCGKPLIGWTIEAALAAQSVSRVVVSTDDAEIAEVSRQFGAESLSRPAEISGDKASSESALLDVLNQLRKREEYVPDVLVFLQCTSPLTEAEDIDGTVSSLLEQNANSAVAVVDFHYFIWRRGEGDDATGVNHEKNVRVLRQDREPQFLESGAVYAMRTRGFLESKHRFFGKTVLYQMPAERRLEIDEPVDYRVAEVLLRDRQLRHNQEELPNLVEAVVFDFDGVFTDNRVIVNEDGRESVICNRSDGLGLSRLKQTGLPLLVLSAEANPVVMARCRKLNIECFYGVEDKLTLLEEWLEEQNVKPEHAIYVGNDVNDAECLQRVGCGVAVADAHPAAKISADLVLSSCGGFGAVRELADLIETRIHQTE